MLSGLLLSITGANYYYSVRDSRQSVSLLKWMVAVLEVVMTTKHIDVVSNNDDVGLSQV